MYGKHSEIPGSSETDPCFPFRRAEGAVQVNQHAPSGENDPGNAHHDASKTTGRYAHYQPNQNACEHPSRDNDTGQAHYADTPRHANEDSGKHAPNNAGQNPGHYKAACENSGQNTRRYASAGHDAG